MSLREKVIKGFVHTYIENEEKIVRNLMQTGRLEKEEWNAIADKLTELAEKYEEGELKPEEYIKNRRDVRKEIDKSREEKKAGMTREEAEKLYQNIKEEQRETLENAYIDSNFSMLAILAKTLSARLKFIVARLKNI
ncbi:MAG: hypothetical protein ABEK04_03880 [Candidatus Nanohalobium sp.]